MVWTCKMHFRLSNAGDSFVRFSGLSKWLPEWFQNRTDSLTVFFSISRIVLPLSLSVFLRFASVDFYHVYHALQKCKFSAMESFGFWVVEKCATISHPWHEMLSASSYVLKMMLLEKCMTSHKMSLFFSISLDKARWRRC